MAFTPEQYLQIAAAYEKAASDYMVPPQHRKAFAQKADWYRMVARIGAKQKMFGVPVRERLATDSFDPLDSRAPQMRSNAKHLFAWRR
jgi:hypothetical protein